METIYDVPEWAYEPMIAHLERIKEDQAISQYAPRVVAGVAYLNKTLPTWLKKIAVSNLELNDGQRCVLGQLAAKSAVRSAGYEMYGNDYGAAIEALGIAGEHYGFNRDDAIDSEFEFQSEDDGMFALNHLWVAAIKLLRKGEPVNLKTLKAKVVY